MVTGLIEITISENIYSLGYSLCYIPETNITLYVNYSSVKKYLFGIFKFQCGNLSLKNKNKNRTVHPSHITKEHVWIGIQELITLVHI